MQRKIRNTALLCMAMAVIITSAVPSRAQEVATVTEKALKGITSVASSIISDSFVPMTHYRAGEWTGTFVPSYFKITRVYDDPKLKGEGLDGFSLGFGGGYALTDRFMAYAIFSYMGIDGKIAPSGDSFALIGVKTEYSLVNFNAGLGFDFINGSKWSAPVYVGFGVHSFDLSLDYPDLPTVIEGATAGGEQVFGSFTLGISASRIIFDNIRVTPYYLLMVGLNKPTIGWSATLPLAARGNIKMDQIVAGMLGLSISFDPGRSFSVSISVGGLITSSSQFYNRIFLDGMEMFSLVMAVTYRGGISGGDSRNPVASHRKAYY